MADAIVWAAVLMGVVTSTGLLLAADWRWRIGFLAALYLSAFFMIQTHWPVSLAAAKLVTGWMACAVLGLAQLNAIRRGARDAGRTQGRLFHFFAAGMVLVFTFAVSPRLADWLGLSMPIAWGSLLLMALGLLQLGISSDPFRVVIGLLSTFCGFEILYTSVESSILVTALLAVVNLGMALAGAYFLSSFEDQTT